jgi:hypothetical protein
MGFHAPADKLGKQLPVIDTQEYAQSLQFSFFQVLFQPDYRLTTTFKSIERSIKGVND